MTNQSVRTILVGLLTVGMVLVSGCGGKSGGGGDTDAQWIDAGHDAGGAEQMYPSKSVTSGGGSVSSENYRLKLFIAPVRPVGTTSSPNYRVRLGPAGMKKPRS